MRTAMSVVLTLALVSCRYRAEPVPVAGPHEHVEALLGDWEGEYWSPDTRRRGNIVFQVTAHGDSAFGDVLMGVPAGEPAPRPADLLADHARHAPTTELLAIRFVAVGLGDVRGELEPYVAPDCDCVVKTVFYGRLEGNLIRGIFVTAMPSGATVHGEWTVRRVLH